MDPLVTVPFVVHPPEISDHKVTLVIFTASTTSQTRSLDKIVELQIEPPITSEIDDYTRNIANKMANEFKKKNQ